MSVFKLMWPLWDVMEMKLSSVTKGKRRHMKAGLVTVVSTFLQKQLNPY